MVITCKSSGACNTSEVIGSLNNVSILTGNRGAIYQETKRRGLSITTTGRR